MARTMNAFAGGSSSEDSESDQDDFLHPSTDPNADEFADYNPRKRRRTGRDAKESAALGVFGSESEDEGPSRRWKNKNIRSKGMAFVSAGQKANFDNEDDDENEDDEDGREDLDAADASEQVEDDEDVDMEGTEETDQTAGLRMGLGAQSSRGGLGSGGLGWQSPAFKKSSSSGVASSPFGKGFIPSSEAVPILQVRDDDEPAPKRTAFPSAFSTPTSNRTGRGGAAKKSTPVNAGSFAARMMAKMGYKEGQGLGKEGQGRSGVIEVQLRPQGAGLGAVREKTQQERQEEKRQAAIRGEVLDDSEEEEKKRRHKAKAARTSGTDSGASTPKRRPKPKYQSLPELQRAAPGLKIPDAFTPILDMTGPGQKLLTSTSGLLTPTAGAESTEVVEARKLARRAQADLGSFVEEWKNLAERKAWIEMEIVQQQQAIDEQKSASEQMSSAEGRVHGLSEAVKDGQWDPVIKALSDVENLGVAGNDELSSIAVAAIHPFLRQAVEGWQPLEDPKLSGVASGGFAPALFGIRELLGMPMVESTDHTLALRDLSLSTGAYNLRGHKTTPYETMIYTVWFPKVRSAITNNWDVHDPTPLQALLEAWDGLLPSFIRSQILDQLLVRKLDEAIGDWNPKKRKSGSLPHLWLFPWLQYLAAHHADPKSSTGLVSDVKRKFRHLIDAWDFRRGVVPGLQDWRMVLRPSSQNDQWTPLLMNHVLPNLARFLRTNFQVAPQDQEPFMPYLHDTLKWSPILGQRIMGQLLVDEMFPMWQDVLHQWLTLDGVNYLEISQWFDWWRNEIPEDLNAVPAVKAEWQRASDMVNQALDLGPAAKADLPAPSKPSVEKVPTEPVTSSPVKPAPEAEEVTFKHQLEEWCIAHDLQFIPEKSMLEANGPVYRVTAAPIGKGGVLIYLRGDQIFAQVKRGVWTPLGTEMDALFELAHR